MELSNIIYSGKKANSKYTAKKPVFSPHFSGKNQAGKRLLIRIAGHSTCICISDIIKAF